MSLSDLLLDRMAYFIPILLSLTVHEWAHAWTAWRLGDDTARMLGRVSLNPLDHIDPVGTLLLPLMGVPFGWAKPVPINPVRFRGNVSMSMGVMLTAAAGPISNLLIAAVSCAGLAAVVQLQSMGSSDFNPAHLVVAQQLLEMLVLVNVLLAGFNMLPIPPLDGSRIVDALIPDRARGLWSQFTSLGPLLLLAVILLPLFGGFSLFAWPLQWIHNLLTWVSGM